MNILITGNAGFIGSHLVDALLEHTIIGIDNFNDYYDPALKEANIAGALKRDNFYQYRCDIRDQAALSEIFNEHNIDMVVHLAAMAGVRPSIENPQLYTEVNINGTVNLLDLCKEKGIKKFVFASSSSVYGNNKKVPFSESDNVDYPISPYAATKKAGELLCHNYHHLYDISVLCLRFFTVYGPRQRPDLAIRKFTKMIMQGKPIPVFGDGSTQRDYTFIDDIIDGVTKAVDFVDKHQVYDVLNLGESQTITLDRMITTLEKYLGIKAQRNVMPMQPGDVDRTFADISKSRKMIGYNPQTSFDEGIIKFIDWIK